MGLDIGGSQIPHLVFACGIGKLGKASNRGTILCDQCFRKLIQMIMRKTGETRRESGSA